MNAFYISLYKCLYHINIIVLTCVQKSIAVGGVEVPIHLIGDAAYPLKKWLMKGFTHHRQLTREQHFNYRLRSARMVVENAFGRLKGRWRCLAKRNDVDIRLMSDNILVCCILHNVCEIKENYLTEWNICGPCLPAPAPEADQEGLHVPQAGNALRVREAIMTILPARPRE